MNEQKFFKTTNGTLINLAAIGSIVPMSVREYQRSWDKEFTHTPYTNEELKSFGFNFEHSAKFIDYEDRRLTKEDARQRAAEQENRYFNSSWRAGYYEVDLNSPLTLSQFKFTGDRLNCQKIKDELYFLPENKRDIPFVYRIHMLMQDGGINNSHTVYTVSVDDYKRLINNITIVD